MKRIAAFILLAIVVLHYADALRAQSGRITHAITVQHHAAPQMGRDLWFAPIENYLDQPGKYFELYVTSPVQTTVYVSMAGQATHVMRVMPYSVASFSIPLGWEIKSSAIVTNKAIHVWSNDGDVSAYLMAHNSFGSEGMNIIPTIGWGVDYFVAAYNALYEGAGNYNDDFPSEFVIIANQDYTTVTITPSTDIREEGSPQACCSCLIHQKGVPFLETLNRGQAIQYQSTCPQNTEDFDFTGTVVHSNNPVGVVSGSVCANIPMDDPYCELVCEMLTPIRTWGKTYYTAPFYPAGPGKQWSSFYVIGSKANQTIYRQDPTMNAPSLYCTISAQYGTYLRPDIDRPSCWTSDAPFYLVQYINSSTYPDGVKGQGDPAEVIINPVEQYSKSVVIQTPTSQGSQAPYTNYVNIISQTSATAQTTFDGQKISGQPHMQIDGKYEITRMKGIKAGANLITSDSGVGVYIYGYGTGESYAWTGSYGTGEFNSPDTTAPTVVTKGSCFYAHIALLDSGLFQSRLNYIRLDSVYNMAYNHDDPNWIEGAGRFSSYYEMFVIDSTREAELMISVFDFAGNQTTITSIYKPQIARIGPPIRDFGVGNIKGAPVFQWDTLVNTGKVPFKFTELKLLLGTGISGFTIDSAVLTPLAVGEIRLIKISFVPKDPMTSYDTILFGDACIQEQVLVYGSGGGADFRITNYNFGSIVVATPSNTPNPKTAISPAPVSSAVQSTHIVNISKTTSITINRVWADSSEYTFLDQARLPMTLPPLGDSSVRFQFQPQYVGTVRSLWHASSNDVSTDGKALGTRNAWLSGTAIISHAVFFSDTNIVLDCASPADVISVVDTLLAAGTASTVVTHLSHTARNDPRWANFRAFYDYRLVNPDSIPVTLDNHGAMVVTEDFLVPPNTSGSYADTITAITANGDTLRVHARVITTFRGGSVSTSSLPFPKVPYRSVPESSSFTITDTTPAPLTVQDIRVLGKYAASYSVSTFPGLPDALNQGQSVLVTVTFDPGVSADTAQKAVVYINWDACYPPAPIQLIAQALNGVAARAAPTQTATLANAGGGRSLRSTLPVQWTGTVHLDIENLLGARVFSRSFEASNEEAIDASALVPGVYFYRLTCGSESGVGKIVIVR